MRTKSFEFCMEAGQLSPLRQRQLGCLLVTGNVRGFLNLTDGCIFISFIQKKTQLAW